MPGCSMVDACNAAAISSRSEPISARGVDFNAVATSVGAIVRDDLFIRWALTNTTAPITA